MVRDFFVSSLMPTSLCFSGFSFWDPLASIVGPATHTDLSLWTLPVGDRSCRSSVMADQEETFGLQNSPSGSDSRDLPNDNNKSEKQNGTSSKSPSSQTTYIQQVSVGQSGGLSVTAQCCEARLLSTIYGVTFTRKVFKHVYVFVQNK